MQWNKLKVARSFLFSLLHYCLYINKFLLLFRSTAHLSCTTSPKARQNPKDLSMLATKESISSSRRKTRTTVLRVLPVRGRIKRRIFASVFRGLKHSSKWICGCISSTATTLSSRGSSFLPPASRSGFRFWSLYFLTTTSSKYIIIT